MLARPIRFVAVALALVVSGASAQVPAAVDSARVLLRAHLAKYHVPGASIAVARNGAIVWSEGFGMANLELSAPATPRTKFRIGSISKTLTSVAVAALWQEGKLDLDAPVQRYVPSFPDKGHPISTRQLAGHLSGIPHYTAADVVNTVHYPTVTAALDKFRDRPLLFVPGERYAYSSFGWNLISAVVEGASGAEFLGEMQRRVFDPFGMTETIADHYARIIPGRTAFYGADSSGRVLNGPAVDNSDVWAGGGFLSTAEDLTRFAHGVLTGRVVADSTRELLFRPMTTAEGKSTGYGLGWRITSLDGRRAVGHGGSHVGASAQLLVVPELGLAVAILSNANHRGLEPLAGEILRLFQNP
ncbi:MAG: serine hydrolase domain-containing protein [Gemmatimonadales bacterium]